MTTETETPMATETEATLDIEEIEDADTTVILEKSDCGFVLREDGSLDVYLPHREPDDILSDHELLLIAIITRMSRDPNWADNMVEWVAKNIEKDQANESPEATTE